ncbi:MAG: tetratricopeptide repeat protein [Gemmatimonadetes bacterium]|nr:tetratricopeptide repeat protein [Gemmatimonadota bacterium]
MSRAGRIAYGAVGAAVIVGGVWLALHVTRRIELPRPLVPAGEVPVSLEDFAGAETCRDCHNDQYASWSRSTHGRAGGPPRRDVVIAPFDGRPLRFKDATVTPSVTARGDYVFTVAQPGRPNVAYRVAGVIGGGHMVGGGTQGFVTEYPDGTVRFLPFDFIRREGVWFCNTVGRTAAGWVPITPDLPIGACSDWAPSRVLGSDPRFSTCQECHASQVAFRLDVEAKRYQTSFATLQINCESCHGPAKRHVELALSGAFTGSADIGLPSLARLSKDQSLDVCFSCHAVKDQLRSGYLPGRSLQAHYSLGLPSLGDRPLFPDGRVRTFAYQETHRFSDCYLNGSMTCVDCHDPHTQGYRDPWGTPLHGRFDDGQCTGCHASKAAGIERHTKHAVGSPGSVCVACHMPYLQHPELGNRLRYARSDHTIGIPRPALDTALGITGACAQCHRDRSTAQLEAAAREWWGDIKPLPPLVAALMEPAAALSPRERMLKLLRPDLRHLAAQELALAELLERHLEPDMVRLDREVVGRLRRLAESDGRDVRALALAALHLAQGERPGVRRFLARELVHAGPEEPLLRDRWRVALGYLGDLYRDAGQTRRALATYGKALEIAPEDPAILQAMGLAYARSGDHQAAVAYYRRSLAADAAQPLAQINLGVALENLGDGVGATAAYRAALNLNPFESLALFNLGNVSMRRRELDSAIAYYQRAIRLDRAMAPAHANLARAYAAAGRLADALAEAQWALELAPADAAVHELVQQLLSLSRQPR